MTDRVESSEKRAASQLPSPHTAAADLGMGTNTLPPGSPAALPEKADETSPLFAPSRESLPHTGVHRFARAVNAHFGLSLASYEQLHEWSTLHVDAFWSLVWDETDVIGLKGDHVVDNTALPPANPAWFKDAKLNWAQNMLRSRSETKIALIEASKFHPRYASTMIALHHKC